MSLDRYQLGEIVAVGWNEDMAKRFPNADHRGCRQEMRQPPPDSRGIRRPWIAYDPPRCHGWHCNRCGAPTNSYGHHECPDRVTP
jgi:hypothetical protein